MLPSRFGRGCTTRPRDLAGKRYIQDGLGLVVSGHYTSATGGKSKDSPVQDLSRTEDSTTSIEDGLTSCPSAYERRTPASTSECETQEGLSTDLLAGPTYLCVAEPDQLDDPLGGNTSVVVRKRHPLPRPRGNASDSDAYSIVDSSSDSDQGLCGRPHIRPSRGPGEDTPKPPKWGVFVLLGHRKSWMQPEDGATAQLLQERRMLRHTPIYLSWRISVWHTADDLPRIKIDGTALDYPASRWGGRQWCSPAEPAGMYRDRL